MPACRWPSAATWWWPPTSARFSQIFAKRGLSVDFGASWLLPRLIGLHRAKELAFFADILSAAEAAAFGLVNRVVPDDELDAFVDDWARRLAEGPTLALSLTKTHAQQFDGRLDGAGARGRGPVPGGQLRLPRHPGGPRRVRRTPSADIRRALTCRVRRRPEHRGAEEPGRLRPVDPTGGRSPGLTRAGLSDGICRQQQHCGPTGIADT